jgi:DNA polymerase III delta' subunit
MLWDSIRGQTGAVNYLRQSIKKEKIVSGYLFQGPSGVGKTLAASIFASALNCRVAPGEGCGSCLNCRKVEDGSHSDVHFLAPCSKSRQIVIDQIKELQKMVYLGSYSDNWKVFVIQDADRMNPNVQNAFLKTLEEPPEKTILILITNQPGYLLPTITSRCQRVIFSSWPLEMMKSFLMKKIGISEAESHVLHSISGGCPGRALQLSQEGLLDTRKTLFGSLLEDRTVSVGELTAQVKVWLDYISSRSKDLSGELEKERVQWREALNPSQRKKMEGRDESRVAAGELAELEMIFELIFSWIRDLFVCREIGGDAYLINRDMADKIVAACRSHTPAQLRRMMEWVDKSRQLAGKTSARATRQLIFENMLLQLGYWNLIFSPKK